MTATCYNDSDGQAVGQVHGTNLVKAVVRYFIGHAVNRLNGFPADTFCFQKLSLYRAHDDGSLKEFTILLP